MSSDVGIEISGLKELEIAFEALGKVGTKAAMTAALRKAVKPVARDAATFAPRNEKRDRLDKKRLALSVKVRTTLNRHQRKMRGGRRGLAEVFVGSTSPPAHLVEFGHVVKARGPHRRGSAPQAGTRHVAPRPFLRPAWDMHKRNIPKVFGREIWNEVARVAKRYRRQAERGKLSRGARRALSGGAR